jgi:acyl-CoA hydrolase
MSDPVPVSETEVQMVRRMMPADANPNGNVYGGSIMKYVDEVAGIVAQRHARATCVTARIDAMNFLEPVLIGDVLVLEAKLVFTGRSSMMVWVTIDAEDLNEGDRVQTGSCFVTMVAIDDRDNPVEVPDVEPQTEEQRELYEDAREEYESRRGG